MTFGVDECRVCGKPIKSSGPEAMQRYLEERRRKNPTMPEKQWRKMGLKTGPTHMQTWRRIDGCCFECQFPMGSSIVRPKLLLGVAIGGVIILMALVFFIGSVT